MKVSVEERSAGMMKMMMLTTQRSPWVCGRSSRGKSIKLENGVLYKILNKLPVYLVTVYAFISLSISVLVEDNILLQQILPFCKIKLKIMAGNKCIGSLL